MKNWLKKYFIPHSDNEHKPHFLRHKSIMFLLLIVIILELSLLVQVFVIFNKTNFLASVLPGVLTSLTNKERVQNNLIELNENELLKKAAQLKANDMAEKGYFAHVSPEGKTPWYWFSQVNYKYKLAGENLAVNFFESEDVARAWMASPTHKANIVKKEYREIGIAVASGIYQGRNAVFVVQLFGTPLENINILKPITTVEKSIKPVENKVVVKKVESTKVLGEEINTKNINKVESTTEKEAVETVENTNTVEEKLSEENTVKNITIISSIKNYVNKLLLSPSKTVSKVLYIILTFVLILLIIFIIKTEIMHPIIIARSLFLISIIVILLFINIKIFNNNGIKEAYKSSFTSIAL